MCVCVCVYLCECVRMCVCVCVSVCVYLCEQLVSIGYPIVKIRHLIERESTTNKACLSFT